MSAYNIDSVSRLMNEDLETPTKKQKETGDAMGTKPEFLRKKSKTPKENPFAKKDDKEGNPFAKKEGKKGNPFAKGGSVEESINRLIYLLEASDQSGMSKEEAHAELEKRINALPPKYERSATPGPKLAAQLASSARIKAHVDKSKAARGNAPHPRWDDEEAQQTGRGHGAYSDVNRVFQNDENNRLKPYLDGLVKVADEIQDPGYSPKNTQNLMQKLQFLGNMVKEIENNSSRFDLKTLKEVINKYANLAQIYEFITKNPTYKIQEQMKQDPKNQAHYQKMLDYVNTNIDKSKEFTRYKDYFTDTFTRFIDDEGLRD